MARLENKTAVVTGAASGFGAGIARRFVEEGARVLIADVNESGAQEIAASLGDAAEFCRTDVTRSDDVDAMSQATLSLSDRADILVNNAGVGHFPGAMESIP